MEQERIKLNLNNQEKALLKHWKEVKTYDHKRICDICKIFKNCNIQYYTKNRYDYICKKCVKGWYRHS